MLSFQKLSSLTFRAAALVLPWPVLSFSNFHRPNETQRAVFSRSDKNGSKEPCRPIIILGASASGNVNPPLEDDDDNASPTLETLAHGLAESKFRNIVVLIGAGMSVSAGIPDFRTPGTGLYSKLEEYKLPYPEAIFELGYFRRNPAPFVDVARAIWPGQAEGPKPTLAHSFVQLLDQKGFLKRVYTQNIDGLERLAGVSDERLIECHGHFSTCSCTRLGCNRKGNIDPQECQNSYIVKGEVMKCPDCGSFVKPDIVFFGEELPSIFMDRINQDMDDCDLLIVMGTSLLVAPVASIPNWVGEKVPRLLINRDLVGSFATTALRAQHLGGYQSRDVFAQGDCDDGVRTICELAGADWSEQLDLLHATSSVTRSR